ncbi:MAG: PadR family transcriptional regulator, partial [bacterium]|nr:PadR family transcriptional regulator [bacterium]
QGSLYPALYRLQDKGFIRSRKGVSEEGRGVKIYRLTVKGERRLAQETENWRTLSMAVEHVLQAT